MGRQARVAEGDFYFPDALPGGSVVVVAHDRGVAERSAGDLAVAAVTLATGEVAPLFDGGTYPRFVNTGHLVFARGGALMAAPFALASLTVGEARTPVVPDLWMDPAVPSSNYAVSASGALVYAPGSGDEFKRTIVSLDGEATTPLLEDRRYYADARVSPTGGHVAIVERAWRDRENDVWIYDLTRGTMSRLTLHPAIDGFPVWTPDGRRVLFESNRAGANFQVYSQASDGTGAAEQLTPDSMHRWPFSVTPDGRRLILHGETDNARLDVMTLDGAQNPNPYWRHRLIMANCLQTAAGWRITRLKVGKGKSMRARFQM